MNINTERCAWRALQGLLAALALILSVSITIAGEPKNQPDSLLFIWLHDADAEAANFLAVIDADKASATYGQVITTVPAGEVRGRAHHTSITLPFSGILFANDFDGNHTYIYDTGVKTAPVLKGSFGAMGEYGFAHSFSELPNGNILATFQSKGSGNETPGGLVELTVEGKLVQIGDAGPGDPEIFLRPYGIVLLPGQDRVVTTTFDMRGAGNASSMQVWRLSDLKLLATLPVPVATGREVHINPFEGRVLADGKTVMFETLSCGLYLMTGVGGGAPKITYLHDFGGEYCGLPVRLGKYWLQTVESEKEGGVNAIIVLDISNPSSPKEVDRLNFEPGYGPHWSSPDSSGRRIVITGYGKNLSRRVLMLDFDPATGKVTIDTGFGNGDAFGPGVMIDREAWPHGKTGPAVAHGAVFWPPADPDWKN